MPFLQIAPGIRVEDGPPRKTVMATPDTLNDKVTPPRYKIGLPDAAGVVIAEGREMEYLDDYAPRVWYVYREHEVAETVNGRPVTVLRYLREGEPHATKDEAIAAATALIGA